MDYGSMDFPDKIRELKILIDKYPRLLDEEWEKIRVLSNNISKDIYNYQIDIKLIRESEKAERR
jgi:hypothetical protein